MKRKNVDAVEDHSFVLLYPTNAGPTASTDFSSPFICKNRIQRQYKLQPRPIHNDNLNDVFVEKTKYVAEAEIQTSTLPYMPHLFPSESSHSPMPPQLRLRPRTTAQIFIHDVSPDISIIFPNF